MKGILASFSLLVLFAFGACKKPVFEPSLNYVPPLVLSTSIYDSLPANAIQTLNLGNITGVQIKHHNGEYSNYFEYDADKALLLKVMATLPIAINARVADTRCYEISFEDFETFQGLLQPGEFQNAMSFWEADRSDLQVYQCIKPPFRHIIQMSKNSKRILHRIEFMG
jgi:hypothetical protein